MEAVMKKVKAIKRGNPLDTDTMVGARVRAAVRQDPFLLRKSPSRKARRSHRRRSRSSKAAWPPVTTCSRP